MARFGESADYIASAETILSCLNGYSRVRFSRWTVRFWNLGERPPTALPEAMTGISRSTPRPSRDGE